MKVLLISPTSPIGGIATWTNEVMNSKYSKDIILFDTGKEENTRSFISILYDLLKSIKIAIKCLFEKKCKVVHINSACSTFGMMREILWIKCLNNKKKIIVEFHCDVSIYCKTNFKRRLLRIILNNIDTCFVLNEFSINYINKISDIRCVFVPNFINVNEKYEYDVRDKIKKIIYLGRICKDKGIDVIQEIAKEFPDIIFELTGPKEGNIEIREKNIIIKSPIKKEEVNNYLRTGDLLIFPSLAEGFPMIYLEAMNAGIPILTNNVGSASYVFSKSKHLDLVLVNRNSVLLYIENIKKLQDKSIREDISIENYKYLINSYTKEKCLDDLFKTYKEISF